jgi:ATP-binding protein involved in chromosome partitioning
MEQKNSPEIKKTILVTGGKGGVGKTTVAVNLAHLLSERGFRTGLLDIDLHCPNAARMLGMGQTTVLTDGKSLLPLENSNGLKMLSLSCLSERGKAIAWRGPMKHKAIQQLLADTIWGELDYLVVDCPPGTGDEIISAHQLLPEAEAVIVSAPQAASVEDAERVLDFLKTANIRVMGLIENMSGGVFGSGKAREFAGSKGIIYLGSIGLSREVASSGDDGLPFSKGSSKPAQDFKKIADKILGI